MRIERRIERSGSVSPDDVFRAKIDPVGEYQKCKRAQHVKCASVFGHDVSRAKLTLWKS